MTPPRAHAWLVVATVLSLAACSGTPTKPQPVATTRTPAPGKTPAPARRVSPYAPAQEDPGKRGNYTAGGLYAPEIRDSAPDGLPDVDLIPEPEVTAEPRSLYGNRSPYEVLGKTYTVLDDPSNYDEVGLASFYGNKFHGRRTSNLEVYDMYAFTAAHKTLPLPSFARVTNLANGKSVIVRVNDRGPFHDGRIIDLSYAAAVKLGVDRMGTARVEVKGLAAGDSGATVSTALPAAATQPAAPAPPVALPDSAIDHLVAALPIASASAAEHPPQSTPNPAGERFDMLQNGRTMTADEFDRWMRSRQLHVATGKAGTMPASSRASPTPAREPTAAPAVAAVRPAAGAPAVRSPTTDAGLLTLQVASFAARTNAERALAMLSGAGIAGARLLDADADGRHVWRLRVGPIAESAVEELAVRLQGLGFGQPQRVRE
ncbi:MAG: septal ring lytic transglycosylase RlpA family protein [Luteimonas sp.]